MAKELKMAKGYEITFHDADKPFLRKARVDNFSKEELEQIVAESFSWRQLEQKLGYGNHNSSVQNTIASRLIYYGISIDHFTSSHAPVSKVYKDEDIFIKDSPAATQTIREHYFKGKYSEYKCSICGMEAEWQDKPLVLTLDHIDGDHSNNEISNLRWVCPNCDRQLETFAGKNIKKK